MYARRLFDYPSMDWQNPFTDLGRMFRRMDRLTQAVMGRPGMNWSAARVFPAVNLTDDKNSYYVRAELPGIKADDLNIQVTGRKLAISGERTIPSEGENIRYHRKEREAGKFSRVINLPGDIDAEHVDAKMVNGVLTVTVAKSEASKPKQITVN